MRSGVKLNENIFTYLWIILWACNFLNLQNVYLGFGIVLACFFILKHKVMRGYSYMQLILIVFFSFAYATMVFFSESKGIMTTISYAILPPSAFLIGYHLIYKSKNKTKSILFLIDILSITMFIYASLNMVYLFKNGWSYNLRGTYDIWTGQHVNSTNQGGYLFLTAIYLPLIYFCKTELSFKRRLLYLSMILLSIVYTLLLANRTYLVILLIEFILCYLLYFLKKKNKISFTLKTIFIIVGVLSLLIFLYNINFLGIQDFWKSTTFYTRMQYMGTKYDVTLRENDRFPTWITTLTTIPKYFWGGKPEGIYLSYAHNMWLDIQWVGGAIPFLLIGLITLSFLKISKRIYSLCKSNTLMQIIIASYTLVIMLECAVEPIIEGYYYIFAIFFLMYGVLSSYYIDLKSSKEE